MAGTRSRGLVQGPIQARSSHLASSLGVELPREWREGDDRDRVASAVLVPGDHGPRGEQLVPGGLAVGVGENASSHAVVLRCRVTTTFGSARRFSTQSGGRVWPPAPPTTTRSLPSCRYATVVRRRLPVVRPVVSKTRTCWRKTIDNTLRPNHRTSADSTCPASRRRNRIRSARFFSRLTATEWPNVGAALVRTAQPPAGEIRDVGPWMCSAMRHTNGSTWSRSSTPVTWAPPTAVAVTLIVGGGAAFSTLGKAMSPPTVPAWSIV